jgi:hypothetical protein
MWVVAGRSGVRVALGGFALGGRGLIGDGRGAGGAELLGEGVALVGLAASAAGLTADLGAFLGAAELDDADLARVAQAVAPELDDAGVAALAVLESRGDVLEDVRTSLGALRSSP